MKRYFVFILLSLTGFGQTIKPTPASETLVSTSKEFAAEKKNLDNAVQQAKSTFDASQKQLQERLGTLQKDLAAKLKADKKYAPAMTEIETVSKQIQSAQSDAENKFQQAIGPIRNKLASDQALINGLIPIVRKESGLSDAAAYNPDTQTWSDPKAEVEK